MHEQEVIDYILQAQKHGLSDFEIKQNLLNVGWEAGTVEDSFVFAKAADDRQKNLHSSAPHNQIHSAGLAENFHSLGVAEQPIQSTIPKVNDGDTQPKTFQTKKIWLTIIILAAILIFGGSGYLVYAKYFQITPLKIWQKLSAAAQPKVVHQKFSYNYSSPGQSSSTTVEVSFNGTGYFDYSTTDLNASIDGALVLNSGEQKIQIPLKYLMLNQVLYLDISGIKNLLDPGSDNQVDWVKFDFSSYNKTSNDTQENKSLSLLLNSDILSPGLFKAKEQLNGFNVIHLKPELNKQNFTKALLNLAPQASQQDKDLLSQLLDKLVIKDFDLYVGEKDGYLYGLNFSSNAPGIDELSDSSLLDATPMLAARTKSRDAQRLLDVRSISSALELYYNDHGGYPPAQNGKPIGLVPQYLGSWPAAPEPADGTCTDYFNIYWYKTKGPPTIINGETVYSDFYLGFCLGGQTGGYPAGIGQSSSQGMVGNAPCTASPELCVNPAPYSEINVEDEVKKLKFSGQLNFNWSIIDLNQKQNLVAPQNTTDLFQLFGNTFKANSTSTPE